MGNMEPIPLPQDWTWDTIVERLEERLDLETSCRAKGAIIRKKVIKTAAQLLRLILAYVLSRLSMRGVAAWADAGGHASFSDVALLKRMRHCGPWLTWLVSTLATQDRPEAAMGEDGRRIVAVDGTVICSPGDKKNYHILHTVYDVGAQCFLGAELTDRHTAERLDVCGVGQGEIRLGDRVYGRWRDLRAVTAAGADYVVRLSATALSLRTLKRETIDRGALCEQAVAGGVLDETVMIHDAKRGERMEARVIVLPLPPEQAEAARRVARKKALKWGYTIGKKALATAGCLMLITSLPREAWPAARVLALYRRRWQVELAFKRLKSLIGLEELRVHDSELVRVWIHAVLLVALLIDAERPSAWREEPDSPRWAREREGPFPSGDLSHCSALA
jgi:hypothetical protein